jgi:murein DD-endopeptidase MepM/ murein hydrolase activator NlpD
MQNYFLLSFLLLFTNCQAQLPTKETPKMQQLSAESATENPQNYENPCAEFNELNTKVRDGLISQAKAQLEIKQLLLEIDAYYLLNQGKKYSYDAWVFPLQGYGKGAIGGTEGSGYIAKGYNYFEGNKHTGHPAHDIFIHDKNQDNIDDNTEKPVNVLSVTGGIVVALEKSWDTNSALRGGIYVWIYDPGTKGMFYYAHNSELLVDIGQVVTPGEVIAHVGRTGLNAYKQRSPTHLHITYLKVKENGDLKSEDIYQHLLKSKRVE